MPWVYELGVDAYHSARRGNSAEFQRAISDFRRVVEFSIHGPMSRELIGRSKEMFMMMEEIEPLLDRVLSEIETGPGPIHPRIRKVGAEIE